MTRILRALCASTALALVTSGALAQSAPATILGAGVPWATGFKPTKARWDALFAAKQDVLNFGALQTGLTPSADNTYALGDATHRWSSAYLGKLTVSGSISSPGGVNVLSQTGVDLTGATDSTTGLQAAITAAAALVATNGLAGVEFPCGNYLISGTLQVGSSQVSLHGQRKGCVQIMRKSDFGPAVQFSNASGVIQNVGIFNINIADVAAVTGASGYSTCANSPYQIVVDGVNEFNSDGVRIEYGCGGWAFRAVNTAHINDTEVQVFQIPGAAGQTGLGTGVYVGYSTNANLPAKYSISLWFNGLELEGGAIGAFKLSDGFRVDGADGVWCISCHVQGGTNADLHLAHNGPYLMSNIQFSNSMADVSTGNGILMDGTVQVQRSKFEGIVSAASVGGANKAGVLISGTGGVAGFTLDANVDGWGGSGIAVTGTHVDQLTIRPKQITNNNISGGAHPDVDLSGTMTNVSMTGGIVAVGSAGTPGIHVGATVSHAVFASMVARGGNNYCMQIDSGATNFVVTGNDFTGCLSGAILDNSGGVVKSLTGNIP